MDSLPTPLLGRCPDCNVLINKSGCPRCGQRFETFQAGHKGKTDWNHLHGEAFRKAFDEAFGLKPLEAGEK